MKDNSSNIPTILVLFGATGDLIAKKIVPALFHLFEKDKLPEMFQVVGFSRQDLSNKVFHGRVEEILRKHLPARPTPKQLNAFLKLFYYEQGFFEKLSDYWKLNKTLKTIDGKWGVCTNKLFYLAVPPQLDETIFENLVHSGLTEPCSPEEGWTRVIVEKPFGKDAKTAKKLDALLGKFFKEIQIYRIDHYLAKDMLQNILIFRFSNNLFENDWNNEFIERIDIRLLEKIGVEDRGEFYDGVGALRDVGQNHLLQILALLTMDHIQNFEAETVRSKRAEILKTLKIPTVKEAAASSFRAQYEGYREIPKVAPDSKTETYFKVQALLEAPRWRGVPVTLEGGKRMGEARKEVIVTFKHPSPCLCPPEAKTHYKNKLIIRLEPREEISVQFWSKKPGLTMELEEQLLHFLYREETRKSQYTEEYEKLLLDCILGDQTLFVSTEEIKAMWAFIDPFLKSWEKNLVPLRSYKPDTSEILQESKVIDETGAASSIKKEIGIVGLGKMGSSIARRLMEKGWRVVGYNRSPETTRGLVKEGLVGAYSLSDLIKELSSPRLVWLMLPAGKTVDKTLFNRNGLVSYLKKGDTVIDGGNSFYLDSVRRARELKKRGINFIDVGVSGGPSGARNGASLMVGGDKKTYETLEPLFRDLAVRDGYGYMGEAGAGHFVKMIHNGIEYGMMQAIAEGFTVLKKSKYKLNLEKVAGVYDHGSVIESRLVSWLNKAFEIHGEDLQGVTGRVAHTGEGEWTVKTAKAEKVKAKVIEEALKFRVESEKNPSYTGKILSALREQFGGHSVKAKTK